MGDLTTEWPLTFNWIIELSEVLTWKLGSILHYTPETRGYVQFDITIISRISSWYDCKLMKIISSFWESFQIIWCRFTRLGVFFLELLFSFELLDKNDHQSSFHQRFFEIPRYFLDHNILEMLFLFINLFRFDRILLRETLKHFIFA